MTNFESQFYHYRYSLTLLLRFHFIGLKLHPKPIDGLISTHSSKEYLGDWSSKAFIKPNLGVSAKGVVCRNTESIREGIHF